MIFLLSPSKTMNLNGLITEHFELSEKSSRLLEILKHYSLEDVQKTYQLSEVQALQTFERIQNFDTLGVKDALTLYEGSVFKSLKINEYNKKQLNYLRSSVRIISAFYGLVLANDLIKPYRLDMKHPIFKTVGKDYWAEDIRSKLIKEPIMINLASDEFTRQIDLPMVHCIFAEGLGNALVIKSTYAKVARGLMMHYAVMHQCQTIESLKAFNLNGYSYQPELERKDNAGNLYLTFARP